MANYNPTKGKHMNTRTKDLPPEQMDMEEKDIGDPIEDEGSEPYEAQVLRRIHEDASILLEEYDEMSEAMIGSKVKDHLVKINQDLESLLTETEATWEAVPEFADLEPLENAIGDEEPVEETEEVEETPEGEEEETTVEEDPNAEVVADDEEKDVPTPEDAFEGSMTKALNRLKAMGATFAEVKSYRKFLLAQKGMCPECGEENCSCGKSLRNGQVKTMDQVVLHQLSNGKWNAGDFEYEGENMHSPDFSSSQELRRWLGQHAPGLEIVNIDTSRYKGKKGLIPGVTTDDAIKQKPLGKDETSVAGALEPGYEEEHQQTGKEYTSVIGKNKVGYEAQNQSKPGKSLIKDFPVMEEEIDAAGVGKSLDVREKGLVGEAANYLKDISTDGSQFEDEHRMKAYHYHKALDAIADPDAMIGGKSLKRGTKDLGKGDKVKLPGGKEGYLSEWIPSMGMGEVTLTDGTKRTIKREEIVGQWMDSPRSMGGFKAIDGEAEWEGTKDINDPEPVDTMAPGTDLGNEEDQLKSMHPHRKMCKDVSSFMGNLSREKAFGDPHREQAKAWHKALEPIVSDAPVEEEGTEGFEPGEMGEKGLNLKPGNYVYEKSDIRKTNLMEVVKVEGNRVTLGDSKLGKEYRTVDISTLTKPRYGENKGLDDDPIDSEAMQKELDDKLEATKALNNRIMGFLANGR